MFDYFIDKIYFFKVIFQRLNVNHFVANTPDGIIFSLDEFNEVSASYSVDNTEDFQDENQNEDSSDAKKEDTPADMKEPSKTDPETKDTVNDENNKSEINEVKPASHKPVDSVSAVFGIILITIGLFFFIWPFFPWLNIFYLLPVFVILAGIFLIIFGRGRKK
jgi:VIT1/CCC1 family predicted Fe2+/Mn2+ transporter